MTITVYELARHDKARKGMGRGCVFLLSASGVLARKLAVILHRMLITGEPFRWPAREAQAAWWTASRPSSCA